MTWPNILSHSSDHSDDVYYGQFYVQLMKIYLTAKFCRCWYELGRDNAVVER
jgi:hypothetical protein